MPRRPALFLLPLLAAALLALTPGSAGADACPPSVVGGDGVQYALDGTARASTGASPGFATGGPLYNRAGDLAYASPTVDGCAIEAGGEVAYPRHEIGGLTVQPKVLVSSAAESFVRHLFVVRNPTDASATIRLHRRIDPDDANPRVILTSSGDATATATDAWMTFRNSGADAPTVAAVWHGTGASRRTSAVDVFDPLGGPVAEGFSAQQVEWQTLTVPPGGVATLASFAAVRANGDRAEAAARLLAGGSHEGQYLGMSAAELASLHNFAAGPDADADGHPNEADNCMYVANADQADLDGDGLGDACDADVDGDGLKDAVEAELGTDPRKADTDGDGVGDRADACPRTPGATDGCPQSAGIIGRVDPLAVSAALTPARDVRKPFRFRVEGTVVPPEGLSAERACRSRGLVRIVYRHGRKRLSKRRVRLRSSCTFASQVSFRNRKRFGRRATALQVDVRWLGNRYLEPKAVGRFSAHVR